MIKSKITNKLVLRYKIENENIAVVINDIEVIRFFFINYNNNLINENK